jgi:hypothetical protein
MIPPPARSSDLHLQTILENRTLRHPSRGSSESDITLVGSLASESTVVGARNMASSNETVELERRRSYGIGGAGNIR